MTGAGAAARPTRACAVCGAWGPFGFDDFRDRPGRYACLAHRDQVKDMPGAPASASATTAPNVGAAA